MTGFIVIGVSGSEHGHPALAWGVAYAVDHNLRVELVHVVDDTWGQHASDFTASAIMSAERRILLERDRISSNHPTIAVHSVVLVGPPDRELVEHARNAELLVVGSHSIERFGDSVFSRRASHIAERAACSVVVVPSTTAAPGTGVVVGVDGSELSARAIRFAATYADLKGEPLTAVHAWTPPWPWDVDPGAWPDAPAEEDELLLAEAVTGLGEDFPNLEVIRKLPSARPADALYGASIGARLLVVGSHGRHGLERAWFGSVSAELVLSMPCPIAVIR
jgi:nucleotide-binding universal stress UspA family protein